MPGESEVQQISAKNEVFGTLPRDALWRGRYAQLLVQVLFDKGLSVTPGFLCGELRSLGENEVVRTSQTVTSRDYGDWVD